MNIRGAIDDTMALAAQRIKEVRLHQNYSSVNFLSPDIGYDHVLEMCDDIKADRRMSGGKLNRWLGWIQCSVVSWGIATLEEMKDINRKHAEPR